MTRSHILEPQNPNKHPQSQLHTEDNLEHLAMRCIIDIEHFVQNHIITELTLCRMLGRWGSSTRELYLKNCSVIARLDVDMLTFCYDTIQSIEKGEENSWTGFVWDLNGSLWPVL